MFRVAQSHCCDRRQCHLHVVAGVANSTHALDYAAATLFPFRFLVFCLASHLSLSLLLYPSTSLGPVVFKYSRFSPHGQVSDAINSRLSDNKIRIIPKNSPESWVQSENLSTYQSEKRNLRRCCDVVIKSWSYTQASRAGNKKLDVNSHLHGGISCCFSRFGLLKTCVLSWMESRKQKGMKNN